MSRRPLVTVPALTLADLLLWHWSLTAPHTVLAIVAGLTLPPLLVASMWLIGLACVRLLARGVRAPLTHVSRTRGGRSRSRTAMRSRAVAEAPGAATVASAGALPAQRTAAARSTAVQPAQVPVASADRERPPRKLAA